MVLKSFLSWRGIGKWRRSTALYTTVQIRDKEKKVGHSRFGNRRDRAITPMETGTGVRYFVNGYTRK